MCMDADPPRAGGASHRGRQHRGAHASAAGQEEGASSQRVCAEVAGEAKGNEGGGCEAADENLSYGRDKGFGRAID